MRTSRIMAMAAAFGALAVISTALYVPLYFGNPNLGSTPVTVAAVLCPPSVGVIAGVIKGIGASIWTRQPFIEIPAGIGDALMAAFASYIARRWGKELHAAVIGQISRYIFTSGMIALYNGLAVSLGSLGPELKTFEGLMKGSPLFTQIASALPPVIGNIAVIWIGIFPAVTLSIAANSLASAVIIAAAGKRIKRLMGWAGA